MVVRGPKTITTLADLDLLSAQDHEGEVRLYRGLDALYTRNLVPGIFRSLRKGDIHPRELEDELHARFIEKAQPMVSPCPTQELKWRAIAQHHGMLTRMLDWTADASVALWFAIRKEGAKDPCIWTFVRDRQDVAIPQEQGCLASPASGKTDAITDGQVSEAKSLSSGRGHAGRTLVFEHLTACSRIVAQKGWFMSFPDRKKCAEGLPTPFEQNRNLSYLGKVVRWSIDRKRRENLLADLAANGINRRSLFPPHEKTCNPKLDSLCQSLKQDWLRRSSTT